MPSPSTCETRLHRSGISKITRVASSPAGTALYLQGTGEDLIVTEKGPQGSAACRLIGSAVLKNAVCNADGGVLTSGVLVYGLDSSTLGVAATPTLRNVTAIAHNAGTAGLQEQATNGVNVTVTSVNSIFEGIVDVHLTRAQFQTTGNATLNATYSFFHTVQNDDPVTSGDPEGHSIPPSPTNQTSAAYPVFADFANSDYHQAADSASTIDKGITDAANGTTDFDGQPRAQGASTDIGADEFVPASAGGGGGPPGGGGGPPPGGGKPPEPYAAITAAKKPACLSIPGVVRDRIVKIRGGGKVVFSTRQLNDPAAPLRLSVKLTGGGSIKSAVFTANGKSATSRARRRRCP